MRRVVGVEPGARSGEAGFAGAVFDDRAAAGEFDEGEVGVYPPTRSA